MKHCLSCRQEFEDVAASCPDCEAALEPGRVPKIAPAEAQGKMPRKRYVPLVAFVTESEARFALAKLDGAGIVGEIVPLGSARLGLELEGARTGVPIAVPEGQRDAALQVLGSDDAEDHEYVEAYATILDDDLRWPPDDPPTFQVDTAEPAGPVPKYTKPWIYAVLVIGCGVLTMAIATCALAQGATSAMGTVELNLDWSYLASMVAACVFLVALQLWLSVIYRNVHAFFGEGFPRRASLGGLLRPIFGIQSIQVILAAVLSRRALPGWVHLAPLGLIQFFVFHYAAVLFGKMGLPSASIGVAIAAHALLWSATGVLLWMTLRLGAAHREVAYRWAGPRDG